MEEKKVEKVEVATTTVSVPAATVVEPGSLAALEVAASNAPDKSIEIAEGAARAKKAFEEGQIPGSRGHRDAGASVEDNAAANDRIREAGLASVVDFQGIRDKQGKESHDRMASVVATDHIKRLGFDPRDHAVKYVGENAERDARIGEGRGVAGSGTAASATTTTTTPRPAVTPPVVVAPVPAVNP